MKPKYNIGDKVWTLCDGKAIEKEVCGVAIYNNSLRNRIVYTLDISSTMSVSMFTKEEEIFETKEALIASL